MTDEIHPVAAAAPKKSRHQIFLAAAALSAAVFVALCLIFPTVLSATIRGADFVLERSHDVLPFTPLLLYLFVAIVIRKYLWQVPHIDVAKALDTNQASCLTLSGFSFTALSVLLSFFKDEIKGGTFHSEGIFIYFTVALGCFVGGFMTLRYRERNLSEYLSEAFFDNGLWCIFVGFWSFFHEQLALTQLSAVMTGVIVIYFVYVALQLIFFVIGYRRA